MEGTKNLKNLSKTLLIFAWIIEIFAVITGLSISLMVGIEAYQKNIKLGDLGTGVSGFLNVFIACLPFILVAVVEFAKIPVVQAAYNVTNRLWKLGYTVLLFFLAFITFETAIQGFERNYRNQNFEIMSHRQTYNTLAITKENVTSSAGMLSIDRTSIIDEFSKQEKVFKAKYDVDDQRLRALREQLTNKGVKTKSIQESITRLDKDLENRTNEYNQELVRINQGRNDEISRSESSLSDQQKRIKDEIIEKINRLQKQISEYKAEKKQLEKDLKSKLAKASIFTRGSVSSEYKTLIGKVETKITNIEADLNSLSVTSSTSSQQESLDTKIAKINKRYDQQLDDLRSEYEENKFKIQKEVSKRSDELTIAASSDDSYIKKQKKKIDDESNSIQKTYNDNLNKIKIQKEKQLKITEGNEEGLTLLRSQESDLLNEMTVVKTKINRAAGDSTVYRLANMFSSAETYADIPQEKANLVATIWFGSLALIIAATGVLLALASEALADQKQKQMNSNTKPLRLLKRFAMLLVDLRKRSRSPKIKTVFQNIEIIKEVDVIQEVEVIKEIEVVREVFKEVPVDKVVFKEIPVEIIKKEIVYVPIYTSDPSLLKES